MLQNLANKWKSRESPAILSQEKVMWRLLKIHLNTYYLIDGRLCCCSETCQKKTYRFQRSKTRKRKHCENSSKFSENPTSVWGCLRQPGLKTFALQNMTLENRLPTEQQTSEHMCYPCTIHLFIFTKKNCPNLCKAPS